MRALKFATLNCVSLLARRRKQWVLDTILRERVDVAFLQETKIATDGQVEELTRFFDRHFVIFLSRAFGQSGGTAIMIRKKKNIVICPDWEGDRNGRVCAVEMLHCGQLHRLVSAYAPNDATERRDFFKNLRQYLDTPCRTILAGDFNCVLAERDCSKRLRADVSRLELRKLLRDFDLVDAKDNEKTADPTYTHWQGNCHARLDRIYLSGEFSAMTPVLEVLPLAFSDHALVTVTLGRPVPRTRKSSWWSSWKLNESLIEDEQLRTQIKELLEGKTGGVPMNAVTWEELKEDVKLKAFRHSQEKAARERAEKRRLMKTLEILIAEENRSPGLFSQDIRDCKGNILELLEKEYRGAMVRSRTLFLERDEEPSKIFKTKERQHASRNKIGKLQVGDVEVTRQEEIEDAFLQAYTDLFTRVEDDGVLQTTGVALPKISPKVRKQMNRKITASEVEEAIKELAPRKSPGVDGLGSQFYKTFSAQLCPILRDVYADVLKRGLLPPYMRQAVTVLIQKKNSKELRAVLQIDLYVEWKSAKFLLFGDSAQSRAWELLALLGLYALWRSRTDHLEVREGSKPAWQHFCDGFLYVMPILLETPSNTPFTVPEDSIGQQQVIIRPHWLDFHRGRETSSTTPLQKQGPDPANIRGLGTHPTASMAKFPQLLLQVMPILLETPSNTPFTVPEDSIGQQQVIIRPHWLDFHRGRETSSTTPLQKQGPDPANIRGLGTHPTASMAKFPQLLLQADSQKMVPGHPSAETRCNRRDHKRD
ncbi:hypothetical protein ISCGN_012819 [Ixodes scapularis]